MEYEEINPNIWKPEEEGDSIEGVLINKETEVGDYKSNAYAIETKDNKQMLVWGCTILDDRMKYVEAGDQIKITYKGVEQNKKGQPVKIYKVYKVKINGGE